MAVFDVKLTLRVTALISGIKKAIKLIKKIPHTLSLPADGAVVPLSHGVDIVEQANSEET